MKIEMKVDIEFWKENTKDTMQELYELLVTDVGMNSWDANEYIEKIYYAVASEFGEWIDERSNL